MNQNQYQNQNQFQNQNGAPTNPNLTAKNAQMAQANYNAENASELAQSQGEISRLLLAKAKQGFEFGNLGASQANNYAFQNNTAQANNAYQANNALQQQQGLEVDQSNGQISQVLSQESRQ